MGINSAQVRSDQKLSVFSGCSLLSALTHSSQLHVLSDDRQVQFLPYLHRDWPRQASERLSTGTTQHSAAEPESKQVIGVWQPAHNHIHSGLHHSDTELPSSCASSAKHQQKKPAWKVTWQGWLNWPLHIEKLRKRSQQCHKKVSWLQDRD